MEILTKGEKIKRARIYKGFTLKQICGDKISVSKLSCIENDKIEVEEWVLAYIAEQLGIDLNYLKKDVKEQLEENLQIFKENENMDNFLDKLKYNLNVAVDHKLYDLAFNFVHELFNYYISNNKLEDIPLLTKDYYDFYQKTCSDKNLIIYYMDMSTYCIVNKEFIQAINYCQNVREFFISKNNLKSNYLVIATYNEIISYIMLKDYTKAYEMAKFISEIVDYEEDEKKRAEIYHVLALVFLRMDRDKFPQYEQKSYELYGDNNKKKAISMYNYSSIMFEIGLKEEAIEYINNSLKYFPKYDKVKLVEFMLLIVDELLENNILDFAKEICDEVLNYAIEVDKIEFIEKSYYNKAKILIKLNDYYYAEMYMNLCLYALNKCGNNKRLYDRYLDMGYMYYNMNNIIEALKYFDLAIKMEKNL